MMAEAIMRRAGEDVVLPTLTTSFQAPSATIVRGDAHAIHVTRSGGLGDILFMAAAAVAGGLTIAIHTLPRWQEVCSWTDGLVLARGRAEDVRYGDGVIERHSRARDWSRVRLWCDWLGTDYERARLRVHVPDANRQWGQQMLIAYGGGQIVGVVPRSWAASRSLSDRALADVCRALVDCGYTPLVLGEEAVPVPVGVPSLAGRLTLEATVSLLSIVRWVVSVDTGLAWAAVGSGQRVLVACSNWPADIQGDPFPETVMAVGPGGDVTCHPCYDPGGCRDWAKCLDGLNWREVIGDAALLADG